MKFQREYFQKFKHLHEILGKLPAFLKFKDGLYPAEFEELIRLAEIGWEVEEQKRLLHVAHCNGVHCLKPEAHHKEPARV